MTSLLLLDQTIKALRTSVVDDVHLSHRIADLLEGLTTSVRHKFVRLAGRATTRAPGPDNTPLPMPSGEHSSVSRSGKAEPSTPQDPRYSIPGTSDQLPYNKNINIMPPPTTAYSIDNGYTLSPANQLSPLISQQQQQLYPSDGMSNLSGTADDWLTLDLKHLVENNVFGNTENPWFGNIGPEINSNLDVLGKFVDEGFHPDMGF